LGFLNVCLVRRYAAFMPCLWECRVVDATNNDAYAFQQRIAAQQDGGDDRLLVDIAWQRRWASSAFDFNATWPNG